MSVKRSVQLKANNLTLSSIFAAPPFSRMRFAKLRAEEKLFLPTAKFIAVTSASCLWTTSSWGMVKYAESSRARLMLLSSAGSPRRSSSIDMARVYSVAVEMSFLAYILSARQY